MNNRVEELEKNFKRMFWIRALMACAILNVVISIFYVHRGLTLREIFFLGIVFALTNLIFEIPSSYMADRWGRKKTMLLAVLSMALASVFCFFANNFFLFVLNIFFYALSYALLSGTDDALIYDTARELGRDNDSLKELGAYYSAQRVFKIVGPLLCAFIVQDLLEWQFQLVIALEFFATLLALPFVFKLVEPVHHYAVEKVEAGIITDAWHLIRHNRGLFHMMISRTVIFICGFLVWRIHQEYLSELGVSVWSLGVMWMIINAIGFFASQYLTRVLPQWSSVKKINTLNTIFVIATVVFAINSFFPNAWVLLISFAILCIAEVVRWPLFSDLFNKQSKSFNRATTLSLTNLIKSVADIPLTLVAAWLVGFNPSYVFVFAAVVAIIVVWRVPVPEHVTI